MSRERRNGRRRDRASLFCGAWLLLAPVFALGDTAAPPAANQEEPPPAGTAEGMAEEPQAETETMTEAVMPAVDPEAAAESSDPRVTLHGYLSQAYATTDEHRLFGITDRGTADYRAAALQVRADLGSKSSFAIQLSHEQLGETELQRFKEEVELDWLFFEHRFGDSSVKVGRVQIPFGIYNEVRDVGTLLPFYRPSGNFYGEGSYTSETVDGILLSHSLDWGGGWSLQGDLHYGNWSFIERSGVYTERKVDNSVGLELWLEPPGSNIRVGTGAMRYDVTFPTFIDTWETYHVSVDSRFGPVIAQAEYKYIDFVSGDYDAGYARLGFEVNEHLTLNAQADYANLAIDGFREGDFDDELVAGIAFAPRPDLVIKLEHHWNEGYQPEDPVQNFFAPKLETQYTILSVSSSF